MTWIENNEIRTVTSTLTTPTKMELDIDIHTPLRSPTPTSLTFCTSPFPSPRSFSGRITECGSANAWQQLCSPPPGSQVNTSSSSQSPINTSQDIKQATSSLPEGLALLMAKSLFLHHHITKHAHEDFLSLLDALFPENNKLPKTLYKFDKRLDQFMKKEEDTIAVHYYCKQCYATQPSPLQYHNIDNGQFHSILS